MKIHLNKWIAQFSHSAKDFIGTLSLSCQHETVAVGAIARKSSSLIWIVPKTLLAIKIIFLFKYVHMQMQLEQWILRIMVPDYAIHHNYCF